jgi:hypothetical protein
MTSTFNNLLALLCCCWIGTQLGATAQERETRKIVYVVPAQESTIVYTDTDLSKSPPMPLLAVHAA